MTAKQTIFWCFGLGFFAILCYENSEHLTGNSSDEGKPEVNFDFVPPKPVHLQDKGMVCMVHVRTYTQICKYLDLIFSQKPLTDIWRRYTFIK